MAAKRRMSKSVVINRAALTALGVGIADGFIAVAEQALELSRPNAPDAPPIGSGLVQTGAFVVYANGRKVGGTGSVRRKERKGIVLYAGYGFPARFQEIGTVHQPARPFFTPSFMRAVDGVQSTVKPHVTKALAGVRGNAT